MKMNHIHQIKGVFILGAIVLALSACNKGTSNTTGWKYNDAKYGGFQVVDNYEQDTPPGMVLVGGGTFTMGRVNEDTYAEWNNYPRRVTVNTFYMDQYEISNRDWKEYVYWVNLMYGSSVSEKCRPDSTVWREELAYNEPYLNYYFTHVAYEMYPVVGVSWEQATDYCVWRSDRVNERILKESGVVDFPDFAEIYRDSTKETSDIIAKQKVFNTAKYLKSNEYNPDLKKSSVKTEFGDVRKTNMSDGLLLPEYRLPTEAEWEFAAYGITSEEGMENYEAKRIYPWDGAQTRNPNKKARGKILANFARGRGDMMGVAGDLNDKATVTAPVNSFWPNDIGLYNMAGNVNEWTMDVYRQTTTDEVQEYNPFRGNVYMAPVKDSLNKFELDSLGRLKYAVEYSKEDSMAAYAKLDVRNYNDGDARSSYSRDKWKEVIDPDLATKRLYDADEPTDPESLLTTKISNTSRVYKGGSWKDRSYWLSPATRRYMEQSKRSNDIGFRCAMNRVGSDKGNNSKK